MDGTLEAQGLEAKCIGPISLFVRKPEGKRHLGRY